MKKWLLTLLVILFCFQPRLFAGEMTKVFMADLDYLYEIGKEIYCYWDQKKEMYGVDWEELYQTARGEMEQAETTADYFSVLYRFMAGVKDVHVNVWSRENRELKPYFFPLSFREIGGKIIIYNISPDAFLGDPGMDRGDIVLAINGEAVERVIDRMARYRSGSTPRMVRRQAIRWLNVHMPFGTVPTKNSVLTILTKDGFYREVEIPWLIYDFSKDLTRKDDAWKITDEVEAKIFPNNIGYLRIGSMMSGDEDAVSYDNYIEYVVSQLQMLLNTDGLVIDVRGNGGGWGDVGDAILAHFIDQPVVKMRASPRLSKAVLIKRPWVSADFQPDPATKGVFAKWEEIEIAPVEEALRYHQPVVVLLNADCFSACDTFVDSLSSNALATMIGEASGGGTGQPLEITLPSELAQARFSVMRGLSNWGWFLEGRGTVPNWAVGLTRQDVINNYDSVLAKGYNMLLKRKRGVGSTAAKTIQVPSADLFSLPVSPVIPAFADEMKLIRQSNHE